jgi:hypothetical protein
MKPHKIVKGKAKRKKYNLFFLSKGFNWFLSAHSPFTSRKKAEACAARFPNRMYEIEEVRQ